MNWLAESGFAEAWRDATGADAPPGLHAALLAAYQEPARVYHGVGHLKDCLRVFAAFAPLAHRPSEVVLALWFHDAVYDPRATDNEERSARWAEASLGATPVAARVAAMIRATRTHEPPPDLPDADLLLDVDLSILGRDPATFDAYEAQTRAEYAWVPDGDFRAGRAAILRRFIERPRVFRTEAFHALYDRVARHNLRASLARLA